MNSLIVTKVSAKVSRTVLCLFCFFGLAAAVCAQDPKTLHPAGYVTDLRGVISADSKARLEALCTELEQKTGAQMAIVTVRSLQNESIEDYAVDLYKQFGIGKKGDDRGVLLLIAPDDRKYKIEVGYGLEPVINDARAGDAGRAMVPFLRRVNNYGAAIETAAWMLAKYVKPRTRGVTLSGQPPSQPRPESATISLSRGSHHLAYARPRFFYFRGFSGRHGGRGGWWMGRTLHRRYMGRLRRGLGRRRWLWWRGRRVRRFWRGEAAAAAALPGGWWTSCHWEQFVIPSRRRRA